MRATASADRPRIRTSAIRTSSSDRYHDINVAGPDGRHPRDHHWNANICRSAGVPGRVANRAHCRYELTGSTLAAVRGIILGHNGTAGWAVTNPGADTSDLVLEQVEGDSYLIDGQRRPRQQKTEVLRYAGGERTILVRATEHGPLVSDLSCTDYPESAGRRRCRRARPPGATATP